MMELASQQIMIARLLNSNCKSATNRMSIKNGIGRKNTRKKYKFLIFYRVSQKSAFLGPKKIFWD
jgi:hypothetical protein